MYKDHRLEETRVNTIVVYITTIAESLSILRRFSSFRVSFDSAYFMYKSIGIEEGRKEGGILPAHSQREPSSFPNLKTDSLPVILRVHREQTSTGRFSKANLNNTGRSDDDLGMLPPRTSRERETELRDAWRSVQIDETRTCDHPRDNVYANASGRRNRAAVSSIDAQNLGSRISSLAAPRLPHLPSAVQIVLTRTTERVGWQNASISLRKSVRGGSLIGGGWTSS